MTNMGSLSGAEIGCCQSHKNVLLNSDADVTLIFEDDFVLCKDFDLKLAKCMSELPPDWEGLWLGGRVFDKRESYSENLLKIKGTTGLYGYMIHKRFKAKCIAALDKQNKLADWAISSVMSNCYRTKESLVTHRAGHSFIMNKYVVYKDLL